MRLWLDDIREPWKYGFISCEWVKTADQAIERLKQGDITFASLDHDLSTDDTMGKPKGEKTGYDVICFMEKHNIWPIDGVRVHSMNPVGRMRMEQVIFKQYGRNF